MKSDSAGDVVARINLHLAAVASFGAQWRRQCPMVKIVLSSD